VRYLSTLLKFIEKAKAEKKTSTLAVEAKRWLDEEMDVTGDLDLVRQQIIGWIMQLYCFRLNFPVLNTLDMKFLSQKRF